jgi:FlgD Ig-like domain
MRSVRILFSTLSAILSLGSAAWAQTGPVPGIPFIDEAYVERAPNHDTWIHFFGHYPDFPPDTCWNAQPVTDMPPTLLIAPVNCNDAKGAQWRWTLPVGQLMPGHHRILITLLHQESRVAVDTTVYQGYYDFDILPEALQLPYVDHVKIAPVGATISRPICPDDSIGVALRGHFPNACFSLKSTYVYSILSNPGPPQIVLIVERGGCLDRPCPEVLQPWSASVVLPPLPAGNYVQSIRMFEVDCGLRDSIVAVSRGLTPFGVSDSCRAPTVECLWPGFVHPNGAGACDAFVSPEHQAKVTMTLRATVALAGLQGRFIVDPAKLRIVSMVPTGVAAGMHLNWVPTDNGARYTLFAESGAPISACGPDILDPSQCPPQPIIEVTLAALDRQVPGETWVNATELLGSDVFGNGVRLCPFRIETDPRIALLGAKICSEPGCDFNLDGRTDVRDLVLMVHCVNGSTACTNPTFDCNRDSSSSIADVICCAIHMLREGRICPECPPDTTRPANVRAALGEPSMHENVVEIPISLIGAEFLGGAVLEFDFPADRYEADVSFAGSSSWIELDQLREGKLAIGLVRTSPVITLDVDQRLDLTLRFTLKPGQTAGGDLVYARGEFSGWDGKLLAVDLGSLVHALGGEGPLALSEPRPNPSAGEMRFSLTVERAVDVEVGVYDLNGRRVATVHRGPLSAGPHEFQWRGNADHGGAVANGIYFYRAIGGGASVTRKLVLLRGR